MSIGSFFGNAGGAVRCWLNSYGPHIATGLGIIGFGVTCVMVARETPKALEIIEDADTQIKDIKSELEVIGAERPESHDEIDWLRREITRTYFRCAGGVAKAYLPAVLMGVCSCGCVLGGFGSMAGRASSLGIALDGAIDTLNGYRERVREAVGEETEDRIYRGLEEREIEVVDTESGEVSKKRAIVPKDGRECGMYTFVFSKETSTVWERNRHTLKSFLDDAEIYWNNVLRGEIGYSYHRHVFLFDVLEYLGLLNKNSVNVMTPADVRSFRMVGWMLEPRINPITKQVEYKTGNGDTGDGFIKFNVREDPYDPYTFYLDFNVDGVILNDITRWLE